MVEMARIAETVETVVILPFTFMSMMLIYLHSSTLYLPLREGKLGFQDLEAKRDLLELVAEVGALATVTEKEGKRERTGRKDVLENLV